MRVVAEDLWFPEGPVWVGDGSLLVVEIRRRTLTQIWLDGRKRVVAELGAAPTAPPSGPTAMPTSATTGALPFVSDPTAVGSPTAHPMITTPAESSA